MAEKPPVVTVDALGIPRQAAMCVVLYWNPSLGWLESPWAKAASAPFTLFMR
jgi:hypothetical protein